MDGTPPAITVLAADAKQIGWSVVAGKETKSGDDVHVNRSFGEAAADTKSGAAR